jgi:UDP-glucose 4-epimerase
MKVLVTGGAGYIGSHAVRELLAAGHGAVVYDSLVRGHRSAVPTGVPFVQGDIRDSALLTETFALHSIDAVMHFAAVSEVGESMADPAKYYRDNVAATLSLLESLNQAKIRKIVFSSTAAVYGEPESCPILEEAPLCPTNVYGRTKLIIEGMLADFAMAYGFSYVALRYFNAAGALPAGGVGEDHTPESHLIPLILKTALGQRAAISIYGTDYPTADGTCIRDYIHVTDLATAHVLAIEHLMRGGEPRTYNLGSQTGFSVREVIEAAQKITGIDFPVVEAPRRAGDPAVLVASSAKFQRDFCWQPCYSELDTILRTAWDWHRSHPDGYGERIK